jgi:hypothetical protein
MLTDLIVIGAKVSSEPSEPRSSEPRSSEPSRGSRLVIPSRNAGMLCAYAAIGAPTPLLGFLIPEKRGLTSD